MIGTACSTYVMDLTKDADHIDLQIVARLVFFEKNNQMIGFDLNLLLSAGIVHICQQRNANLFACQMNLTKVGNHIDLRMVAP